MRVGARAREQRRLQDHVCREQVAGGPTGIVLRLVLKGRVVSSKSCLPFLDASRMPGKRHTTNAKHVTGQLRRPRGERHPQPATRVTKLELRDPQHSCPPHDVLEKAAREQYAEERDA